MKEVEAKKLGTEVLLEEMGAQRFEAEAQQVRRYARRPYPYLSHAIPIHGGSSTAGYQQVRTRRSERFA